MKLQALALHNFRNYDDVTVAFGDGVNVLLGENAQGKTNLLEAIYFLALARSHRTSSDRDLIDPTGFHNKRVTYDGQTDWLYNRSHLIGYQLTGQNNNLKNLMTGTRSLNAPDMEQYEDEVASYLKEHPHSYLRYQVIPIRLWQTKPIQE